MLNTLSHYEEANSKASTCPSSLSSLDVLPEDERADYEDIVTIEIISEAKFPVYLVYAPKVREYFALKAFPWEGDEPSHYFLKEVRFHKFHHPYFVSIPHFVVDHEIVCVDLSYLQEDGEIKTTGTKNFRAPELLNRNCKNPQAADIYSAGIVLFLFKTGGNLPYLEVNIGKEGDFSQLKDKDPDLFWEKHCQLLKKDASFFSQEFKDLFHSMTKFNPNERVSIAGIKGSRWYQGPVYSRKELIEIMKEKFDA